jgi:hypothetical protein
VPPTATYTPLPTATETSTVIATSVPTETTTPAVTPTETPIPTPTETPVPDGVSVTGRVWRDDNHNGNYDTGEGLADVVVILSSATGTQQPTGIWPTTTDGEGVYSFDAIPAGDYLLRITDLQDRVPSVTRLLTVGAEPVPDFDIVYAWTFLPLVLKGS